MNVRMLLAPLTPTGAQLVYGWHLDGPGPARHGWAWVYPTGKARYLGKGERAIYRALLWIADEASELSDGRVIIYYYRRGESHRQSYTFPAGVA